MASETETQLHETSSVSDRLFRNRDIYLFLPFILGFSNRETQQNPNHESPENNTDNGNSSSRERIILVNPFTQGMAVIEGASSLDPLLRILANNTTGQPPASKASVDAMPRVDIGNDDYMEGECVICLDEWVVGDVAREMPCKHKFHSKCVEDWLGLHGTCPICRYKMPADEEYVQKDRNNGERGIWVSFRFNGDANGNRPNDDSDQNNVSSSNDDDASVHETEG